MDSPPVTGGKARAPLRFNATQTPEEDAAAQPKDAYYRQSLLQLGRSNANRIIHQRQGSGNKRPPPSRCVPLADVLEGDISRCSKYAGKPAPKSVGKQRESARKRGQRVGDSFNAFTLLKRLGAPEPTPPERPSNPEDGFDDDAIGVAKRGRMVAQKSMDTTPAQAHAQWGSYVRLERERNGPDASLDHLTREYREAATAYKERWGDARRNVNTMWEDYVKAGGKAKGKQGWEWEFFRLPARPGKGDRTLAERETTGQPEGMEEEEDEKTGSEQD